MTPTLADRPFYGRFAWAYDLLSERSVASECGHVAAALARHGVAPGARLLDAGCGTGRYAAELARHGFRVTGVDASLELLAVARRRPDASAVTLVAADLTALPIRPCCQAILCRGVLNDVVPDAGRRAVFLSFARALTSGGVLVLDVREWEATVRRKSREPVHEQTVETVHGTLTFRSVARLDHNARALQLAERHTLVAGRVTTAAEYDFVMRCWTRDELDQLLTEAGFGTAEYHGAYDPAVAVGATDRLVIVARQR